MLEKSYYAGGYVLTLNKAALSFLAKDAKTLVGLVSSVALVGSLAWLTFSVYIDRLVVDLYVSLLSLAALAISDMTQEESPPVIDIIPPVLRSLANVVDYVLFPLLFAFIFYNLD